MAMCPLRQILCSIQESSEINIPVKLLTYSIFPIPWMNIDQVDLSRLDSKEFTSHSLGDSMFYFPPTLNLAQEDARWFAWGRKHFLTYPEAANETVGSYHAGWPGVGPQQYKMANLTFYSYFFYLDPPTKQQIFDLLTKMTPQQPYREFAARVIKTWEPLTRFTSDEEILKQTYGVSTLERTPQEAVGGSGTSFPAG